MRQYLFERISERITDGVAVGAVTSPLWLESISGFFAGLLPFLGCLWITIQIVHWYRTKDKK